MEKESQYFQLNEENIDDPHQYYFKDSGMAVMAAHQLMQLSDEDDQHSNYQNNNNNIKMDKEKQKAHNNEEEVDQIYCRKRYPAPHLVKKITEEIFGKDDDDDDDQVGDIDHNWPLRLSPKIMKRRYRSLTSIYRKTQSTDHHLH